MGGKRTCLSCKFFTFGVKTVEIFCGQKERDSLYRHMYFWDRVELINSLWNNSIKISWSIHWIFRIYILIILRNVKYIIPNTGWIENLNFFVRNDFNTIQWYNLFTYSDSETFEKLKLQMDYDLFVVNLSLIFLSERFQKLCFAIFT